VAVIVVEARHDLMSSSIASWDSWMWACGELTDDNDGRRRLGGVRRSWAGTAIPRTEGKRTQQVPDQCRRAEGDAHGQDRVTGHLSAQKFSEKGEQRIEIGGWEGVMD
jgi:hypothetical protein